MKSGEASRSARAALEKAGWPSRPIRRDEAGLASIAATRQLFTAIGGSNLILDPDLDSYYEMDLVLLRLPELVDQAGAVLGLARTDASASGLDDAAKANFLITAAFSSPRPTAPGLRSASGASADGSVAAALSGPAKALAEASSELPAPSRRSPRPIPQDGTGKSKSVRSLASTRPSSPPPTRFGKPLRATCATFSRRTRRSSRAKSRCCSPKARSAPREVRPPSRPFCSHAEHAIRRFNPDGRGAPLGSSQRGRAAPSRGCGPAGAATSSARGRGTAPRGPSRRARGRRRRR